VYNESAKMAADFAENNQIFFVHPTSLSTDILANHPRTFLFQPSFERQAEQALNFMRSLPKITNRKVAIYYSNTRKDSVLAANYRTKALATNYLVIDFRKTREKLDSTAAIADWNRPGHVVIFGNSESDGTKVMTMMTKRRVVAPILASSSAFNLTNASASALSKEIYLLDTDFIDTSKPQVREFQAQYMAKRNTIPSVFTMQGYDMLLFFGRMLHKFQSQLRVGLDTRTYEEDYLLSSFNYQKSNDNQTVPIWKVTDMRIERVNE
jgi:ABC-type branched-subunit amino acid transport system substrate-binding protein